MANCSGGSRAGPAHILLPPPRPDVYLGPGTLLHLYLSAGGVITDFYLLLLERKHKNNKTEIKKESTINLTPHVQEQPGAPWEKGYSSQSTVTDRSEREQGNKRDRRGNLASGAK